ncbi:MAG: hypothetical protein EBX52_05595 [Proteobacteria bacterium]|nr:hypothetical protein [Pseudomonadota bacterium]
MLRHRTTIGLHGAEEERLVGGLPKIQNQDIEVRVSDLMEPRVSKISDLEICRIENPPFAWGGCGESRCGGVEGRRAQNEDRSRTDHKE